MIYPLSRGKAKESAVNRGGGLPKILQELTAGAKQNTPGWREGMAYGFSWKINIFTKVTTNAYFFPDTQRNKLFFSDICKIKHFISD